MLCLHLVHSFQLKCLHQCLLSADPKQGESRSKNQVQCVVFKGIKGVKTSKSEQEEKRFLCCKRCSSAALLPKD